MSSGVLRVKLSHAVGLKSADSNGYSDPYVKLKLGKETKKSQIVKKTLNPRWDETFDFRTTYGEMSNSVMQVECWDWDRLSFNDSLGNGVLNLTRLISQGLESSVTLPCSVQLKDNQAQPGEIFFEITWMYDGRGGAGMRQPPPPMSAGAVGYGHLTPGYGAMTPHGNVPQRVLNTFSFFDVNRSGYLDYGELRNALRHYGIEANILQSAEIIRRYDDRPDGKLEIAEFAELIKDLESGVLRSTNGRSPYGGAIPARVAAAFEEHDTNRSGYLDYAELRGLLRRYGIDASEGEAASIVRAYDDRPDGKLDVAEFARLVRDIESGVMRRDGGGVVGSYRGGYDGGHNARSSSYAASRPRSPYGPGVGSRWRTGASSYAGYERERYGGEYGAPASGGTAYPPFRYGGYGGYSSYDPDSRGMSALMYVLDVLCRTVVYALATAALINPQKVVDDADYVAQAAGQKSAAQAISTVPVTVWYSILGLLLVLLLVSVNCCGLRRPIASCFDCVPGPCSRFCHAITSCCCWSRSYYERYSDDYYGARGSYGRYSSYAPKAYERV